ncbi:MAG: hypothetical protein ACTJHK_09135, partial [Enterococcus viikkiensis]
LQLRLIWEIHFGRYGYKKRMLFRDYFKKIYQKMGEHSLYLIEGKKSAKKFRALCKHMLEGW